MSTEQIIREALALPVAERTKIDAVWAEEIEDRIDALEAGEIQAEPGEEVLRRLRERKK